MSAKMCVQMIMVGYTWTSGHKSDGAHQRTFGFEEKVLVFRNVSVLFCSITLFVDPFS